MPMPKKRITSSRRGMRRSHDRLRTPGVSTCPNCNSLMRPHHACPSCGYYRGREVVASANS